MQQAEQCFKSAVDLWFYAVIAFVIITLGATIIPNLSVLQEQMSTAGLIILFAGLLLGIGLPIWMLFSTYYIVTPDTLIVRCAPFRWTIPRAEITAIVPSRSLLSSPALSLKRLEISYANSRAILVSPRDEAGFRQCTGLHPLTTLETSHDRHAND